MKVNFKTNYFIKNKTKKYMNKEIFPSECNKYKTTHVSQGHYFKLRI